MIRRLTTNLPLKLLSLALAALLWFVLVGEPELTATVSVPVQYKKLAADFEIASDFQHSVQLEVRGPSGKLSALAASQTPVILDLSEQQQPGERTFTIREHNVQLPPGVSLARAIPSQLRLRLERRVTKEVPVEIRFAGPAPAGYRVSEVQVTPEKVRIEGPSSHVERIDSVETDPVQLGSVTGEAEYQQQLFVGDPQVRLSVTSPVRVRVKTERVR
ncbi:MAG: CdaR family protein [Bryobacteraceae bacterium]|nr:CdaR family protein [Bryobacteraceae bacterium]